MNLWSLCFLFMYVGLCSIGGGLVSLSVMQRELLIRGMVSAEHFYSMVAISESTPGPIGINLATYVGYEYAGIAGALVCTSALVFPSFIIIFFMERVLRAFQHSVILTRMLYGLRAGALGMIAGAVGTVFSIAVFPYAQFFQFVIGKRNTPLSLDVHTLTLFLVLCALSFFFKRIHPVFLIFLGALGALCFGN